MKKRLIGISAIALSSLLLVACGQKSVKSGSSTIYDTRVNKTTVSDHEWKITGTTSAPDGAKIIVTPTSKSNLDYGENGATNYDEINWAKVKNGKFTAYVNPLDVTMSEKSGNQTKVAVMAVTGYSKKYDDDVSSKAVSAFTKQFETYKLKMSSSQAKYIKSLDDEDDDSSSSSSSSSTDSSSVSSDSSTQVSYTPVTYEQLARNENDFMDQKVSITGNVIQVQDDGAVQTIRVSMDDVSDSVVMVQLSSKVLNGTRVLEDDNITINGKYVGLVSYETVMGSNKTIPGINAKSFTINQ